MKRIVFGLLALLSLCSNMQAQTFSVDGDVEALSSGETVSFKLRIAGATEMTSMHFEMDLPTGVVVSNVSMTSDWTSMFSFEGGAVSGISTSTNAFTGDGHVATVQLTVADGTALGSYPITFNEVRVNGNNLASAVLFNLNIVDVHTIVLDETSTAVPEAATGVNVRVKRTIEANTWSTICLPFAMTEEQAKAAFGDDVQLGNFTGYEITEIGDEITGIAVNFNAVNAIDANHPYIIKVTTAITEFGVDGVDIAPEDEPTVATVKRTRKQWSEMIGTYVANTEVGDGRLFLSDNQFWYSTGATKMKAFRAYFDFFDVLTSYEDATSGPKAAPAMIRFGGSTTGITTARHNECSHEGTYNLQGQKVENVRKGLYIRNGKKVVVK